MPNAVQTGIGPDNKFNVFNAGGFCDVVGTFYQYPSSAPASAASSHSTTASVMAAVQPLKLIKRS